MTIGYEKQISNFPTLVTQKGTGFKKGFHGIYLQCQKKY